MSDDALMVHVHKNGGVPEGGETAQYMAQSVTVYLASKSVFIHQSTQTTEVRCDDGGHYEIEIGRNLA
jgi:hypothetical protein